MSKMANIRDGLLLQKKELEGFCQKHYVQRNIELKELSKDIIKVIIGLRRT
jgi:hypothetical protein